MVVAHELEIRQADFNDISMVLVTPVGIVLDNIPHCTVSTRREV